MKRRSLFGGALAVLAPACAEAARQPEVLREERALMGTRVRLLVPGRRAELRPALDAAWSEMARLERQLSRYREDSLLGQLAQRAGGAPLTVTPLLAGLLVQAKELAERSGGALDPTVGAYRDWTFGEASAAAVPSAERLAAQRRLVDWRGIEIDGRRVRLARAGMRLDLGALAKLPILDAGLQQLRRHGVQDALIDGGGDLVGIGQLFDRPWQVGIRDPLRPQQMLAQFALRDGWLASSGDYERCFERDGRRYHHILDPRSGLPSQGVHGVSLVARDWRAVNGLGTALMVAGPSALPTLLREGAQALMVGAGGQRWQSAGWVA